MCEPPWWANRRPGSAPSRRGFYVLDVLYDRFRSPEDLREQLVAPVLAIVRRLPASTGEGIASLQVQHAPDAVESEAFRTLRTALAISLGAPTRIAITSSEPGDGKTTVASNLAAACAQAGRRTLLIDADLRRPGLTKLLALRGEAGLSEALRSSEPVAAAAIGLIRASGIANLDVLPCGGRPHDPAELLAGARFAADAVRTRLGPVFTASRCRRCRPGGPAHRRARARGAAREESSPPRAAGRG